MHGPRADKRSQAMEYAQRQSLGPGPGLGLGLGLGLGPGLGLGLGVGLGPGLGLGLGLGLGRMISPEAVRRRVRLLLALSAFSHSGSRQYVFYVGSRCDTASCFLLPARPPTAQE
jgi:hypothetical protein